MCSALQAAAAMEQASASRPQPSQAIHLESEAIGAPQMILDEETGQLVLDPSSLTMQAQPRQEYTRREEGQHDIVNSQSYMKRENTARWSPEETEEFYSVHISNKPFGHSGKCSWMMGAGCWMACSLCINTCSSVPVVQNCFTELARGSDKLHHCCGSYTCS